VLVNQARSCPESIEDATQHSGNAPCINADGAFLGCRRAIASMRRGGSTSPSTAALRSSRNVRYTAPGAVTAPLHIAAHCRAKGYRIPATHPSRGIHADDPGLVRQHGSGASTSKEPRHRRLRSTWRGWCCNASPLAPAPVVDETHTPVAGLRHSGTSGPSSSTGPDASDVRRVSGITPCFTAGQLPVTGEPHE
jgi:hypothetical protein